MIDRDELSSAWCELEKFKPLNNANPSTQEQGVMNLITFYRGKISRFGGDFLGAESYLLQLLRAKSLYIGIFSRVTSHLIAVYCELGDIFKAMHIASSELKDLGHWNWLHQGKESCLKLALADTHLATGLWISSNANEALQSTDETRSPNSIRQFTLPEGAQRSLKEAKETYEKLQRTYQEIPNQSKVFRMNRFRILAGLAIISQLESQLETAVSYWNATSVAAEKCSWEPGFAEMIIAYSMSQITFSLDESWSIELREKAEDLFLRTGRRFYFTILGTVWFDLVGDLIECKGGRRIARRRNQRSLGRNEF